MMYCIAWIGIRIGETEADLRTDRFTVLARKIIRV